jgi:hypothetical protein
MERNYGNLFGFIMCGTRRAAVGYCLDSDLLKLTKYSEYIFDNTLFYPW